MNTSFGALPPASTHLCGRRKKIARPSPRKYIFRITKPPPQRHSITVSYIITYPNRPPPQEPPPKSRPAY